MIKIKIDRNCEEYKNFVRFIDRIKFDDFLKNNKYCTLYCSKCNYYISNIFDSNIICETCFCGTKLIIEKYSKLHKLHKTPRYGHPRLFYLLLKRISKLHPSVRWMYIESHIKDD